MSGKYLVGIGMGASRVKIVLMAQGSNEHVVMMRDHSGDPRGVLGELLKNIDVSEVLGLAITGRESAALSAGSKVFEGEAVEEALRLLKMKPDVVISLGGESFVVYPIAADGTVLDCVSGNRCAAGTVEFFKQQLGRMNLSLKEAMAAARAGSIVPLAKRCSVHCKSDCTHALNKKSCTVADIVRTLCYNMAEKAAALVKSAGISGGKALVIGGAASNEIILEHMRELMPDFEVKAAGEAGYFEALGAASLAGKESLPIPTDWALLFGENAQSFGRLPPLSDFRHLVNILPARRGKISSDRRYILGIDGGSTTTKAALVDFDSLDICGSHYTRTNGDPERAMKECLSVLADTVLSATGGSEAPIVGIATTGSSGEILSVLCRTDWHHNEIIAHARGASHFCPEVDTIFEIGGQDSKFTSLRSHVPIDFNMNESCSAGTGSFIEETAREDLGVPMEQIAELALRSKSPPRFSDQCAAFANSDTRKAFQEGATREDNLAGLTYAIVENYISKVVGRRRIGDHILFQGGTSKNLAIACAFAARTGRTITIPPDSEYMGCFGIALWLRNRILDGEAVMKSHSIDRILHTKAVDAGVLTCRSCENYCKIRQISINGRKHPFGGQCSKWENVRRHKKAKVEGADLVARRNHMLFREFGVPSCSDSSKPVIGMMSVFSIHTFYPLFSHFFDTLGYAIDLSEKVSIEGVQRCQSARCYPYEIAHGTFHDLVSRGVNRIFVPHVSALPLEEGAKNSVACPIAQAAPYYLASAFKTDCRILAPVIEMTDGLESAEEAFLKLGAELGHSEEESRQAFKKGCRMQRKFQLAAKEAGARFLKEIEQRNEIGIVLVGRPYNAFSRIANMGVPRKFASAGVTIVPDEFLPYETEPCERTMYWKYGQTILRSMRFISKHPRLFAVYISNFGCGPDSFIQHYSNEIMGRKPYLYLELDSHTADAGIATRTAAFLDIVAGYRKLGEHKPEPGEFTPAELVAEGKQTWIRTSSGELVPFTDPRVTLAFPSMGRLNTEAVAAASRRFGIRAVALPPADERILRIGKEFTSGKECSPAILTTGALVSYCRESFRKERSNEILLFFMPTANGPCRFGQYNVYMKKLIRDLEYRDVLLYSPSAEDGYRGMGHGFLAWSWVAIVAANVMSDIRAALNVAAKDRPQALRIFEEEWRNVTKALERGGMRTWLALRKTARRLARIPSDRDRSLIPKVLLAGEIFVRSDELSCQGIDDMYAAEGMMIKRADSLEWVYFTNWHYLNRLAEEDRYPRRFLDKDIFLKKLKNAVFKRSPASRRFIAGRLKLAFEQFIEARIRGMLGRSGWLVTGQHNIDHVVRRGSCFINPALYGEAILTAGSAVQMMEHAPKENYCGVVFIGPFNCMPTGVAESVIKPYARENAIPYLTFETDGGPIPSNLQSQMEVHVLRSRRYADAMTLRKAS